MNIVSIVKNVVKIILFPFFPDYVVKMIRDDAPWVYISYLPHVYRHLMDEEYLDRHQNLKETVKIVEVFNKMGYNVYLHHFTSTRKLPRIKADVIFGLEPNFNRACEKWPDAKKVYFATGAYWEHANKQITQMTDYINNKYSGHIKYKRMTKPHNASQLADLILQIGSSYTITTYPKDIQSKITTIDQSSLIAEETFPIIKNYAPENEFFFMGSGGNVLKGVSLLLEFFSKHQELTLNWVGPIEDDFKFSLNHLFTPNIRTYGFVNMKSDQMRDIVSRCNFIIYPSGTEGCPGAVIHSMQMGLIPIVTPWAAFDGIEPYSFIMRDWSEESIELGIAWALKKNEKEIENLSCQCATLAKERFNLERFGNLLEVFVKDKIVKPME